MANSVSFSDTVQSKSMPGQMLKTAREAQNITIEAVSKHLHLTVPTIVSIEEDQYQNMPAPVYVRGYLRRYAQFVNLSPEEVLKAYQENVEVKSKVLEEIPNYAQKKTVTSSHIAIRFLTYGIAVILLILVGLWWKGGDRIEKNPAIPNETKVQSPTMTPLKTESAPSTEQDKKLDTESRKENAAQTRMETLKTPHAQKKDVSKNPALESMTQRVNGATNEIKVKSNRPSVRRQEKYLDLY